MENETQESSITLVVAMAIIKRIGQYYRIKQRNNVFNSPTCSGYGTDAIPDGAALTSTTALSSRSRCYNT